MTPVLRYDMLRAFVVVEFCLDASVRWSLIELSPGQRTVSEYSSTEVWVRRLNLRRISENRTSRRIYCNSGEPGEYRNRTHQQNLPRPLIQRNSGAGLKPWNFGSHQTTSVRCLPVVLHVVYKLRVAHSCRTVSVFIHRECVNKKSKTSTW